MPDPIGDAAIARARKRAGQRVKDLQGTTLTHVRNAIAAGMDMGEGAAVIGARVAAAGAFGEYRAEMIARTETMVAWNTSAIDAFAETGTEMVEAQDGDEDEMCRERNGQIFTVEEAMQETLDEHPNGTLSWMPVIDLAQLREDVIAAGLGG
jgi:hypothetical protein